MRRFRFSIGSLLGLVLFLGFGLAALKAANDPWDAGVFGVTLIALLTSVLLAVHRAGSRRAYWLGFALFGCAHFTLALVPQIEARLPTTKALAYLDSKISDRVIGFPGWARVSRTSPAFGDGPQTVHFTPEGAALVTRSSRGVVRLWDGATGIPLAVSTGTSANFVRIGHSLLALIIAFLGAHLSRYLHASESSRVAEETRSSSLASSEESGG